MRAFLSKGGVQLGRWAHDAQAVRTENAHAVAAGDFQYLAFQCGAGMAALGKAAGHNQGEAHTALAALFDNARHRHGRRTDNRQIDAPRYVVQGLEGFLALNCLVFRIDREQTAAKARLQQITEQHLTDRVFAVAGAEYGNAFRFE